MAFQRLIHCLGLCPRGAIPPATSRRATSSWRLLLGLLLFAGITSLCAAYPPILVVDGVAVPGVDLQNSSTPYARQYTTPSGLVVVLHGVNGGQVSSGNSVSAALNAPASTGSWDGGLTATLAGHSLVVPQVLVYYAGPTNAASLVGYDIPALSPVCNSTVGDKVVQAYSGLPQGEIFTFGTGLPCYRYLAGPTPTELHAEDGWPASNVLTFPSTLMVNGSATQITAFNEGITSDAPSGYWCNAYYGAQAGQYVADIHVFIPSESGVGTIWGNADAFNFSSTLTSQSVVVGSQGGPGVTLADPASGPLYGPPQLSWNGVLMPFVCESAGGGDVYYDAASNSVVVIDSTQSVIASSPYATVSGTYDRTAQLFSASLFGFVGVSADGTTMLGSPGGVTVITSGEDPGPAMYNSFDGSSTGWDAALQGPNNTVAYHYPLTETLFQFSGSPIYAGGGTIDATEGWPTPSIFQSLGAPSGYDFSGSGIQGSKFEFTATYPNGSSYIIVTFFFSPATGSCVGWGSDGYSGAAFSFSFSVDGGGSISNITGIPSFPGGPPVNPASHGPPRLTWNGVPFVFSNTDGGNIDWYTDSAGDTVTIDAQGGVTVDTTISGGSSLTGTYNPVDYTFNFSGNPAMQNFAAQDINGELLGTPPGLEVYVNAPANIQAIQLGDGTYRNASNTTIFTFTRAAGSNGIKYIGIPENSIFRIQDSSGAYSPVYIYRNTYADSSVDRTHNGNWPATNLFPATLYVNGAYSQQNAASIVVPGTGQSQEGGVSYNILPANGNVAVHWTWNSGGFNTTVGGSYAAFTQFSNGHWDGRLFSGLPAGLVIATAPPRVSPTAGRPWQIVWSGVNLTFDGVASSVSGSNPTGANVYRDGSGLGLTAIIASNGATTLISADGVHFTGTYSAGTQTFTFTGQSPGTTAALNNTVPGNPSTSPGQSTQTSGNFNIRGNYLTLGTWLTSSNSYANALSISYVDAQGLTPSQIRFASSHRFSDWVWSEATADNTDPQVIMMKLDKTHRLILNDTTGSNTPGVTLDPAGPSKFKQAILIAPQGDLSMGEFTAGPTP